MMLKRLPLQRTACVICLLITIGLACNLTSQPMPVAQTLNVTASSANATPQPAFTLAPTKELPASCAGTPKEVRQATGNMVLCFINLDNGQTIPFAPGQQTFTVVAEASGAIVTDFTLSANNYFVTSAPNSKGTDPARVELNWHPANGDGEYTLVLGVTSSDKSSSAIAEITVHVQGMNASLITPSMLPTLTDLPNATMLPIDSAIRQKIIDLYRTQFGLTVPNPAITHKERTGRTDPWVSTAYIGKYYYEIYVYPDGKTDSHKEPLYPNQELLPKSWFKQPVCRPAGTYSILVVFVDYGNISYPKEALMDNLQAATTMVNAADNAYHSGLPGYAPILTLKTTGVVIPPPSSMKDHVLTPSLIRENTTYDPDAYQWIMQVDLDSAQTARRSFGNTMENTSFGYAFANCETKHTYINVWVNIDKADQLFGLQNRLATTLLSHEVYHLFGYPATHAWACSNGTFIDHSDDCGYTSIPALMLGWVDTDDDGIAEIMDPTPYGS
jgi:hypothetical protein